MSTSIGQAAEKASVGYLEALGLNVVDLNWKTRQCEIDIIATKKSGLLNKITNIHFVEVKYRSSSNQGDGLDSITTRKLEQMRFAAESWVYDNNWSGSYQLDVVSVGKVDGEFVFDYRPNITG